MQKTIIILGMHRSGTSLVAELVNKWGAYAGNEQQLIPPNEWNPQGYWEYLPLVHFNDELLASVSANWSLPPFGERALIKRASETRFREKALQLIATMHTESNIWFWKDPRLAILLPFWERIWENVIYIIPVRQPLDIARSLEKRDGFSISASLLLWQYYTLAILRHTESNQNKLFIEYEQCIQEPVAQCRRLCNFLEKQCGESVQKIEKMAQVVNPKFMHFKSDDFFSKASHEQKSLYQFLKRKFETPTEKLDPANNGWEDRVLISLLFQRGSDFVKQGKLSEGLTILSRLLELNKNHFETLQLMGDLYHTLGKKTEARQMWELALSLRPGDLTLIKKLGKPEPVNLTSLKKLGKAVDCSIIIPVFNQLHYTKRCLDFLKKNTPRGCYEIIVVDNHSTDGTADFLVGLDDIHVIRNDENFGFSKACNQGAKAATNEFILFLNNDVEVQEGWLTPLVLTLLEDPQVAVVGSKLLYPDGTIQHAGVVTIDNRKKGIPLNPYHIYHGLAGTLPEANVPREYSVVTAACLLTRKSIFEKLGGFDQSFRNGYEDVDYCYKVGAAGFKVVYRPESVAIHYESQSGPERFACEDKNFRKLVSRWKNKIPLDIRRQETGQMELVETFKTYQNPSLCADAAATRFKRKENPKSEARNSKKQKQK